MKFSITSFVLNTSGSITCLGTSSLMEACQIFSIMRNYFSSPAMNQMTIFIGKQLIIQDLDKDIAIKLSSFIFKMCPMDQQNQYNLETLRNTYSQAP